LERWAFLTYFLFALWLIGHGPNSSSSWVVFHNAELDYAVRHVRSFGGAPWKTSQARLPAATFAGVIERLEGISIPLAAEPQGMYLDGGTSGFAYCRGEQIVMVSWYYPPEEWQELVEWHCGTREIFERLACADV